MDYQAAAKQIQAGARRLQWITDMAEALDKIGSIEAAEKVAQGRLDAAKQEAHLQEVALQKLVEATAAQQNEMTEIIIVGQKQLQDNIDALDVATKEANDDAAEIIKAANMQAGRIVGTAQVQAEATREGSKEAQEAWSAATLALNDLKLEHDAVVKAIEDAKANAEAAINAMRQAAS